MGSGRGWRSWDFDPAAEQRAAADAVEAAAKAEAIARELLAEESSAVEQAAGGKSSGSKSKKARKKGQAKQAAGVAEAGAGETSALHFLLQCATRIGQPLQGNGRVGLTCDSPGGGGKRLRAAASGEGWRAVAVAVG